jgi:hypothetical protein
MTCKISIMNKFSFFLSFVFLWQFSIGQKVETVYLNTKDSTSNLYIVLYPPKLPYKGFAFLIPGMFQKANDVLVQTELPGYAAQQGILTIIPTFKTGISSFGFDTATQASFLELLEHVTTAYKLKGLNFYVGGFSIGGTCAIKYAELAFANNYPVKPSAVFAIDAPLDFERMYNGMLREIKFPNSSEDLVAESNYVLKRVMKEFGGSPSENLPEYHKKSPYSFNDTTQHSIKPLVSLPIRLYTEPDILWWINEGVDYSLMNSFDFAAMTNELKRMGNKKVELMITTNKGYRKPDNTRHPHSWSIVDPKDIVQWMLSQK